MIGFTVVRLFAIFKTYACLEGLEKKKINSLVTEYLSEYTYWLSFFKYHNIKLFLTWSESESNHIVKADAVNSLGGIAAYWQGSFLGKKEIENSVYSDIGFYYSNFSDWDFATEDWADSFVVSNTARWNMNHWIPHAVAADYALTPDHDDRWRTGGSVDQILAESELDEESLKQGVLRFIADRDQRFARMNRLLSGVRASKETDDSMES